MIGLVCCVIVLRLDRICHTNCKMYVMCTRVQRLQEYEESVGKHPVRARFFLENIIRWNSYVTESRIYSVLIQILDSNSIKDCTNHTIVVTFCSTFTYLLIIVQSGVATITFSIQQSSQNRLSSRDSTCSLLSPTMHFSQERYRPNLSVCTFFRSIIILWMLSSR
jgi:hypothetical protein